MSEDLLAGAEPRFQVRTFAYPDDYPEVIELWETAGPGVHVSRSDAPGELEKKLARDPELFLVAEQNGKIIGSVLGGFDGRRGIIYHLAVQQEHRQNGVGSVLMEVIEDRLRALGCIRSYLLVTPDNPANTFYQRRGWEKMDITIYGKHL